MKKSRVQQVITAHEKEIASVVLRSDGGVLATADWNGALRLWDVVRSERLTTLTEGWSLVAWVALSPDGATLASTTGGRGENTLHLWDAVSGTFKGTLARS